MPEFKNPKYEIFAVEKAAGAKDEAAFWTAGVPFPMPAETKELGGQRRSRIARQAIRRIEGRIVVLEALNREADRGSQVRNLRAIAELRWCQRVLENGGTEPEEWIEDETVAASQ